MVIDPLEDTFPVSLHGAVDGFVDSIVFVGLNNVHDDFYLNLDSWYQRPLHGGTVIMQSSDFRC